MLEADRPMVDLRAFRRKHLGFVFQKANLIPFLAAGNVQAAMEINDTPPRPARHRTLELLDYVSVAERADNRPDALSGCSLGWNSTRMALRKSLPHICSAWTSENRSVPGSICVRRSTGFTPRGASQSPRTRMS